MTEANMTCKARYERLSTERLQFLDRARRCSELTIPTLVPPEGHTKSTVYYTPWQGIGAKGVNNLASKLLLSLLPPNSPLFRLVVDDFTQDEIAGRPGAKAKVDEGLNKIERAVQAEIEGSNLRNPSFLSFKHLIVAGNVLMYFPADGGVRVYRLDKYVVKRDPSGNVLDIIAVDEVSPSALTEDERQLLDDTPGKSAEDDTGERTIEVYTRLHRKDDKWRLYQEINGKIVPGSEGSYPLDKSPMLPLRWTAIDGEDYGRSYVEEYLGDLISLEGLSKAIVQASAAAAKVVFLLNPNGVTRMRDVAGAESGDFVIGKKDDVSTIQTDKQADMRITYEAAKTISERLSMAFLMHSSVQRQAERVTAEEIRFMASELEDSLGGVYSILSQEFQLPLVNRLMDRMTKQKRLPALPKGVVKPAIVTGLEALGRGHDLNKYNLLLTAISPLGPEVLKTYMNPGDYISRIATSLGIDSKGLVKTDEQLMQEQQQAQQMQQQQMLASMAEKGIPNAVKGISDNLMSSREQQQAAPEQPPA